MFAGLLKTKSETENQEAARRLDPRGMRRREADKPVTSARARQTYERPTSFTNHCPWMEYLPQTQSFVLEDGASCAALFELTPIGTEGRSEKFLVTERDNFQHIITDPIPEMDDAPWVLQFFVQDEPNLWQFTQKLRRYIHPDIAQTDYSRRYLELYQKHVARMTRPGGVFLDSQVTGSRWRGQQRRVRACLYRRGGDLGQKQKGPWHAALARTRDVELNEVAAKLVTALSQAGVQVRRGGGQDLWDWMVPWLNPRPPIDDGDAATLLGRMAYPGDDELPFGFDLAENMMLSLPVSDSETATWWFNGLPHKCITVQCLRAVPSIGHITAERQSGDHIHALFDRLPEHTVMTMTVVFRPQDHIRNHISAIFRSATGDSPEASLTRSDAKAAELEIARGNKLYPVSMAFYVRGDDERDLRKRCNEVNALCLSNGMQPIAEEWDLLGLDSYLRNLPMNYQPSLDKIARRSRLVFSRHIANLLPVYGRSTGTGNPGVCFFNRGAEPFCFDPLNHEDRKKNAHMLIVGPTGAGKSATCVYLLQHAMAVYRPRVFIIEAGASFYLLGQHFADQGLTVNQVTLSPNSDVSLPPFADAIKLLEPEHEHHVVNPARGLEEDDADDTDERRDILGEMEIAARIMITGGDVREDARMTRADRLMIRKAILHAAKEVRETGRNQVLTIDVANSLRRLDHPDDDRRKRAREMADGMELFCSGLAGHFFNREGTGWPDADVTIVDMATLAREGYEDQLTVAYIGLMNSINALVEGKQYENRPTIVLTDEGHIITTNPLLAPYVIKITKMWRKLGTWFWIATQSLQDFPDASRKMLNMLEWWLCLVMPKDEIEQIGRFKDLTEEQLSLLMAARKEPKKYTEGVVLADHLNALFRVVVPSQTLALAMTEKDEKAERRDLMKQHNCSELEAAYRVARRLEGMSST